MDIIDIKKSSSVTKKQYSLHRLSSEIETLLTDPYKVAPIYCKVEEPYLMSFSRQKINLCATSRCPDPWLDLVLLSPPNPKKPKSGLSFISLLTLSYLPLGSSTFG